jgi:hypothetical protein
MLRYQFHPDASLEYSDAVDYYIEINPLLADAFVAEVEHAILIRGQRGQELILDIFNPCGAQNEFLISET